MGMYDVLYISSYLLPDLTEGEKLRLPEGEGWQTKDLDSNLDVINISNEGILSVEKKNWLSMKKGEPIPVTEEFPKYTGDISFYTLIDNEDGLKTHWLEFKANFIDGNLTFIERVYVND